METAPVLVTGAAGFIGFHVAWRLLAQGRRVVGLDNLNSYYSPALKCARLAELAKFSDFCFAQLDIADSAAVSELFAANRFQFVVHLAAQPGVRHSLVEPQAYVLSNLQGFVSVLEGCRRHGCHHLLYASSSSVYGANTTMPFSIRDSVDHPLSLYGATKKANELMAHAYSHLYDLPATGLRFFTVYGPWGRPDMAVWLFTSAIDEGRPIKLFNHGVMRRDFTYIDDVTEAIIRLINRPPKRDAVWSGDRLDLSRSSAPWRIYNVGSSRPVELMSMVSALESALNRKAILEMVDMQQGDALATFADVSDLERDIGFSPMTSLEEGLRRFVEWYKSYKATSALG